MSHACVFWIKDRLTSIVKIDQVPAEDRYKGAVSRVHFSDGKDYPAKIILVSDNMSELEQAEDSYMASQTEDGSSSLKQKRKNKGMNYKQSHSGATEKEISVALGEKPRLNSKLVAAKKKVTTCTKADKANLKEASKERDLALFQMKKSCSKEVKPKTPQKKVHISNSNSIIQHDKNPAKNLFKASSANKSANSNVEAPKKVVSVSDIHLSDDDIIMDRGGCNDSDLEETTLDTSKDSCIKCSTLKCHDNSAIKEFLWDLAEFMGMDLKSSTPAKSTSRDMIVLPVRPVPEYQMKVEITPNSGLWISKAAKSRLLITCDNDPYKLTRQAVEELYGKEALRQPDVTAMGQGTGGRGIGATNLEAIYRFVKRNTPWDTPPTPKKGKKKPCFTFTMFVREINKKLISLRRRGLHPVDSDDEIQPKMKKLSPRGQPSTKCSDPTSETHSSPQNDQIVASPSKESNVWKVSPLNQTPTKLSHPSATSTMVPQNQAHPSATSTMVPQNQAHPCATSTMVPQDQAHPSSTLPSQSLSSITHASQFPFYSHQSNPSYPGQNYYPSHPYPGGEMFPGNSLWQKGNFNYEATDFQRNTSTSLTQL